MARNPAVRRECGRAAWAGGLSALWLAIAITAVASVRALGQQPVVAFAERAEMIDAIMGYAYSGGCGPIRDVFGKHFDSVCDKPDRTGMVVEHMFALGLLRLLRDDALIEVCKRNKIRECEAEASRGRPVLTLVSAVALSASPHRPTWSPDSRFLLLDGLPRGESRLLDVEQGTLGDQVITSGVPDAVTWSPDGKYIARSERRPAHADQKPSMGAVRLYASVSLQKTGVFGGSKEVCSEFGGVTWGYASGVYTVLASAGMAFTADANALWVTCFSQQDRVAKAIKLKVPGLVLEDSMVLAPPGPGWQPNFTPDALVRHAGELILVGRFKRRFDAKTAHLAVQLFSLTAKRPLYPPIVLDNSPGTQWTDTPHLTDDLSGVYAGADELRSTKTGERLATGVKSIGRYLGAPNRLSRLGLHLESRAQKGSPRGDLIVVDSASGATVQEIGPIPRAEKILVSPDGLVVAVFGFQVIRFYRVNP